MNIKSLALSVLVAVTATASVADVSANGSSVARAPSNSVSLMISNDEAVFTGRGHKRSVPIKYKVNVYSEFRQVLLEHGVDFKTSNNQEYINVPARQSRYVGISFNPKYKGVVHICPTAIEYLDVFEGKGKRLPTLKYECVSVELGAGISVAPWEEQEHDMMQEFIESDEYDGHPILESYKKKHGIL